MSAVDRAAGAAARCAPVEPHLDYGKRQRSGKRKRGDGRGDRPALDVRLRAARIKDRPSVRANRKAGTGAQSRVWPLCHLHVAAVELGIQGAKSDVEAGRIGVVCFRCVEVALIRRDVVSALAVGVERAVEVVAVGKHRDAVHTRDFAEVALGCAVPNDGDFYDAVCV